MLIWACGERTWYGWANSGYWAEGVSCGLEMGYWKEGKKGKGEERTKYHPVGFPVLPIWSWEVRTKRTLGWEDILVVV